MYTYEYLTDRNFRREVRAESVSVSHNGDLIFHDRYGNPQIIIATGKWMAMEKK